MVPTAHVPAPVLRRYCPEDDGAAVMPVPPFATATVPVTFAAFFPVRLVGIWAKGTRLLASSVATPFAAPRSEELAFALSAVCKSVWLDSVPVMLPHVLAAPAAHPQAV